MQVIGGRPLAIPLSKVKVEGSQMESVKDHATISISTPGQEPTPPVDFDTFMDNAQQLADAANLDTGEIPGQLELTGHSAFIKPTPRRNVPMVKVSFGGTVEMEREQFEALTDGKQLAPGLVTYIRAVGFMPAPHAAWVKRKGEKNEIGETPAWWEPEGRVAFKITEIGALDVTGLEHDDGDE